MMELTSSQKQTIQHQFDCFCKKILRDEKADLQRKIKSRTDKEILFSEMTQKQMDELSRMDTYSAEKTRFTVKEFEVLIESDLLAEALALLPEANRNIVLLSYFLEISDTDIAEMLNMVRRTVHYRRTSSLNKMKKHMEGTKWKNKS